MAEAYTIPYIVVWAKWSEVVKYNLNRDFLHSWTIMPHFTTTAMTVCKPRNTKTPSVRSMKTMCILTWFNSINEWLDTSGCTGFSLAREQHGTPLVSRHKSWTDLISKTLDFILESANTALPINSNLYHAIFLSHTWGFKKSMCVQKNNDMHFVHLSQQRKEEMDMAWADMGNGIQIHVCVQHR